jgi:hypothetical protein
MKSAEEVEAHRGSSRCGRGARRRAARGRGGRVGVVVVRVRLAEVAVVHLVVGERPRRTRPAVAHHDRAVDERRERAELVGDQHDRGAARLERRARRRGPAGWAGRRRRSARRGRAAPARRRARGRSAPAAAGRRTAWRRRRGRSARPTTSRASRSRAVGARQRAEQRGGSAGRRRRPPRPRRDAAEPRRPLRDEADPRASGGSRPAACRTAGPRRCQRGRPVIARTSVDLPEPLAPISATNSPGLTVRSMPRRTGRPRWRRRRRAAQDGCRSRARGLNSVGLLEGGEVLAHERKVVLAGSSRRR